MVNKHIHAHLQLVEFIGESCSWSNVLHFALRVAVIRVLLELDIVAEAVFPSDNFVAAALGNLDDDAFKPSASFSNIFGIDYVSHFRLPLQ